MKRKTFILLTAIVLLGFGLRAYKVSHNPVSTYWDETAIGYDAFSLAETGKDMHVGSSRVDLQACKLEYSIVSPK